MQSTTETLPDTDEIRQAQVAVFAHNTLEPGERADAVYDSLGAVALGEVDTVTATIEHPKVYVDEDSQYQIEYIPSTVVAATRQDLDEYLQNADKPTIAEIESRAEILGAYPEFAGQVRELKQRIGFSGPKNLPDDLDALRQDPAYLGRGSQSIVYQLEHDGKNYVVKMPYGKSASRVVDSLLPAAVAGKGLADVEQVVAASYEDGVLISEMIEGTNIGEMTPEEIAGISSKHLAGLFDTMRLLHSHGLSVDPKPTNYFYEPQTGFKIIDYDVERASHPNDMAMTANYISDILVNAGTFHKNSLIHPGTLEAYAEDLTYAEAKLPMLTRYREVAAAELTEAEQAEVLPELDVRIAKMSADIEELRDVEGLKRKIAEREERRRQREREPVVEYTAPVDDFID